MCVCSTGSGRSGKQGRGGPLPVGHMMPQGNLMSVCRAGPPQGGAGYGRGVPWREGGSKRDRGTERLPQGKKRYGRPHREDWRGERKDRAAGPMRAG